MYELLIINAHRQYDEAAVLPGDWLGVYLLAAFLDSNGHPARAFAGYAHEVPSLLEQEMSHGVKVVGFSCDYENQVEVTAFCRMVKERWAVPVVVGGPQAVALGEDFLRKSGADVCVRGEGELPLLALMHYFVDATGDLNDIKGISFLRGGSLITTPDQPPLIHLDALPFPDPALALGTWFRRNTASFLTARGCPFRCSFCYEGGNTRSVRWRSVDNVMDEVRLTLKARPDIRYILFTDDTFTLNATRVRNFVQALSELRRTRDFGWFAEAHPATLLRHPELLVQMMDAGLVTLQIGVESGNADILRAYNKKTTPSMIEEVVALCRASGLAHMVANIIVGGAWESEESCAQSQEFGLRLLEKGSGMLELHAIHFWPLPGTAITKNPQSFGMEILDPQSLTAATDYPVVRSGLLTPERLSCLRADMDSAFRERIRLLAASVPSERIELHFSLARRYHFHTGWYYALYGIERCRRYAALRHSGAGKRSHELEAGDILHWHPQRTCSPIMQKTRCLAGDMSVDESLYPVLVASAGRMTTKDAAAYCGLDVEAFLGAAKRLEDIGALLFCQY